MIFTSENILYTLKVHDVHSVCIEYASFVRIRTTGVFKVDEAVLNIVNVTAHQH